MGKVVKVADFSQFCKDCAIEGDYVDVIGIVVQNLLNDFISLRKIRLRKILLSFNLSKVVRLSLT